MTEWLKKRVDPLIRPFCYSLFLLAILGLAWVLFLANDATQQRYLTPIIIFLSATMATSGWMWSGQLNRKLARRSQAITLLLALRSPEVDRWKTDVYNHLEAKEKGGKSALPIEAIQNLLGLYELVAVAVMNGAVDEEMMVETQGFVFLRLYTGLRGYIEQRQKEHAPLYCHFVHYAEKWNTGRSSFVPYYISSDREFLREGGRSGSD